MDEGALSSQRADSCAGGGGELGVVVVESGVSDFSGRLRASEVVSAEDAGAGRKIGTKADLTTSMCSSSDSSADEWSLVELSSILILIWD